MGPFGPVFFFYQYDRMVESEFELEREQDEKV
jgi:hypothetical protein